MNYIDFFSPTGNSFQLCPHVILFSTRIKWDHMTPTTSLLIWCIFQSNQLYFVFLPISIIPVCWVAFRMTRTSILETYVWNGVELFPVTLYLLHNAGSTRLSTFWIVSKMWSHHRLVIHWYQHCRIFVLNNSVDETQNSITLIDPWPGLQGSDIFRHWIISEMTRDRAIVTMEHQ